MEIKSNAASVVFEGVSKVYGKPVTAIGNSSREIGPG